MIRKRACLLLFSVFFLFSGYLEAGQENIFRDITDSLTVTLPPGARQDVPERLDPVGKHGDSYTYTLPGVKDGALILLSTFYASLDGEGAFGALLDELEAEENGLTTATIQGRYIPVGLYTTPGGKILVTALFAEDGLLIAVLIPEQEFAGARRWIRDLIYSVRFLETEE